MCPRASHPSVGTGSSICALHRLPVFPVFALPLGRLLRVRVCGGHLYPRVELVFSTFRVVIIIHHSVGIIVQLSGLWKRKKHISTDDCHYTRLHNKQSGHVPRESNVCSDDVEGTYRIIVKSGAVVVVHAGRFIKHEVGLIQGLFCSRSEHVCDRVPFSRCLLKMYYFVWIYFVIHFLSTVI